MWSVRRPPRLGSREVGGLVGSHTPLPFAESGEEAARASAGRKPTRCFPTPGVVAGEDCAGTGFGELVYNQGLILKMSFFILLFFKQQILFLTHSPQIPSQIILLPPFQQVEESLNTFLCLVSLLFLFFASVLMFFAYFASLFKIVNFLCQSMDMPIYEGDGWVKKGYQMK